ncbi:PAS fold [Devosia enhydra]|uniref:histidine kinase n=2 Tax=Devosia enhydra TaxID=665118 RepID=A0A1K2I463_9HYPH|nr:PAS fold [Devosia enhydra]
MAPELFRNRRGFAVLAAAPMVLLSTVPALAQSLNVAKLIGTVPLAVALGGGAFALLALILFRRLKRDRLAAERDSAAQVASLRALLDEYEALLAGGREVTLLWSETGGSPRILGTVAELVPAGRRPEAVLDFASWTTDTQAKLLSGAVEGLRVHGRSFETSLKTRDGRLVRAAGWVLGGGVAIRLRLEDEPQAATPAAPAAPTTVPEIDLRPLADALSLPAWVRGRDGRLSHANPAYGTLVASLGRASGQGALVDLVTPPGAERSGRCQLGPAGAFAWQEVDIGGQRLGLLTPERRDMPAPGADPAGGHLGGIIDALATPIAIFSSRRELIQFNRAYADLWGLDPDWLRTGPDERTILDRLRTESLLPAEPDYHGWRARHLESYTLKTARESDPWHLPDGRTLQVIAAPAGGRGGVIYVFEDITAQLNLRSINRALLDVQRSTLNALTEAVAVFGTNGRLTLSNPQFETMWSLSLRELGPNPHIDRIAEASTRGLPEDGPSLWRDLKRGIIDLTPARTDTSGRVSRSDGRLLDYNLVRLPDGQTMMTFLDVTESANYSRLLKEHNDALVTADRLKDAFVQNVSYELRSPLTDIIGFAHLLASEEFGPLNARQRAYTDYIQASSVTLGVLIDNILDLATVDAGIAQLRTEPQDIRQLVEKARAGLAATFPEIDGERAIALELDIPLGLPPLVADGTRLVQVLYNLLSSAARFSEKGGRVRLSAEARGGRVVFIVEDEGPGPTEEMRAALSGGEDLSARQRGAGLGLAIVRSFVHLHGGTVSMEAREPRGTRVVVNLPQTAAMAGAAE